MIRTLTFLLLATGTPLLAADFYVSSLSGNDATGVPGNSSKPYAHLWYVTDLVHPGDTVQVMNGTYYARDNSAAIITAKTSGTPTQPITWKAYPGHKPELIATRTTWYGVAIQANYIVIDGLIMTGINDSLTLDQAKADALLELPTAPFSSYGVQIDCRKTTEIWHHTTLRNLTIRKFSSGGVGIIASDHITIENCKIYDNAWYSRWGGSGISMLNGRAVDHDPGYHVIIRNNVVWNNKCYIPVHSTGKFSDGNGIILDTTINTNYSTADDTAKFGYYNEKKLVANNVALKNGAGGIVVFATDHADVVNNTLWQNSQFKNFLSAADYTASNLSPSDLSVSYSKNVRVINNIASTWSGARPFNNSIDYDSRVIPKALITENILFDRNLFFGGTAATELRPGLSFILDDPRFEAPGDDGFTAKFNLLANSKAIDAGLRKLAAIGLNGTIDDIPAQDMVGNSRPKNSGVDLGAFEYQGTDTTAPFAASPSLSSSTSARPTISGISEPGATVKILIDGVIAATPAVNFSTDAYSWQVSPALAPGLHAITITVKDTANNQSAASSTAYVVVLAPPSVNSIYTNLPVISLTALPFADIFLYDGDTSIFSGYYPKVNANGVFDSPRSYYPAFTEGPHALRFKFKVTNPDGSTFTSDFSPTLHLAVDTVRPAAPLNLTTSSIYAATPTLSGTAEANATVSVFDNGVMIKTLTASAVGTWSWTVPAANALSQGNHSITAKVTDAAGNVSGASATLRLTVDTISPATPAMVKANSTTSATPRLFGDAGAAEAYARIQFFDGLVPLGLVQAYSGGNYSFSLTTALSEGLHLINATASDTAGNTSGRSAALVYRVPYTAAPGKPGPISTTSLYSATPTLSGTTQEGATVLIYDGAQATPLATVTADASGAWTWTVTTALKLSEGNHSITVKAKNTSTKVSVASDPLVLSVDTIAPVSPTLVASSVTAPLPMLSGLAEANSTVSIFDDSTTLLKQVTAAANGTWSWTVNTSVPYAAHVLTATATDAAGNIGPASASLAVDTTLRINFQPVAPTTVPDYLVDAGFAFQTRTGVPDYGWNAELPRNAAVERRSQLDQRLKTLVQMQINNVAYTWEISVPTGRYNVHLVMGDPVVQNCNNSVIIEPLPLPDVGYEYQGLKPLHNDLDDVSTMVNVTDGRLTIAPAIHLTAGKYNYAKLNYIEITRVPTGSN